ncbi:MAG: ATP-binding cassette domain-containing protein, partial [Christensenella sp.]
MENKKLVIEGLSKEFGTNEVLKNIGFDVNEGEFLSVLGPSGCGKTTIL